MEITFIINISEYGEGDEKDFTSSPLTYSCDDYMDFVNYMDFVYYMEDKVHKLVHVKWPNLDTYEVNSESSFFDKFHPNLNFSNLIRSGDSYIGCIRFYILNIERK